MKLYNVYYHRFDGSRNLFGMAQTEKGAWNIIKDFLTERNYKSPYYNITQLERGLWIDFGSYTNFFEFKEA